MMKRASGLSLIELMVSLFLSSLIVMFLMQQWSHLRQQTHRMRVSIEDTLEVHWLAEFIQHRVRLAGYTPCLRLDHLQRIDTREKPESLHALEITAAPQMTIRRMDEPIAQGKILGQSRTIEVDSQAFKLERPVLISDCEHAEVHQIDRIDPMKTSSHLLLTLKEPLYFQYPGAFNVGEWVSESFFIQPLEKKSTTSLKGLFYRSHRVDLLSSRVQHVIAQLERVGTHDLLHLILFMGEESWTLDTLVRAP